MKQSNIQIREMVEMHVSQIAKLEELCFTDPWPESSIRDELTNPLSLWLVAVDAERVIGYIGSQSVLGEADILNVAVDPAYRRCGIAEQLLLRLEGMELQNQEPLARQTSQFPHSPNHPFRLEH